MCTKVQKIQTEYKKYKKYKCVLVQTRLKDGFQCSKQSKNLVFILESKSHLPKKQFALSSQMHRITVCDSGVFDNLNVLPGSPAGGPFTKNGSMEVLSWDFLVLPHGERIPIISVSKRFLCGCGCKGKHTFVLFCDFLYSVCIFCTFCTLVHTVTF